MATSTPSNQPDEPEKRVDGGKLCVAVLLWGTGFAFLVGLITSLLHPPHFRGASVVEAGFYGGGGVFLRIFVHRQLRRGRWLWFQQQ